MKGIPKEAIMTREQITGIPAELRDQAMALIKTVETTPGVSIAILFHVEGQEDGDAVPLMLAGKDLAVLSGHLLGTAMGLASMQGLLDGTACQCPACAAKRAGPGVRA